MFSFLASDPGILSSLLLGHTFWGSQVELSNLLFIHRPHIAQHFCEWTTSFPLHIFILLADCWKIGSKTQQNLGEYFSKFGAPFRGSVFLLWVFIPFRLTLWAVMSPPQKQKWWFLKVTLTYIFPFPECQRCSFLSGYWFCYCVCSLFQNHMLLNFFATLTILHLTA